MTKRSKPRKSRKSEEQLPPNRFVFTILGLLVFWLIFSSLAYVWIQMETIQTGYNLVKAHRRHESLLDIRKKLEVEWNYQRSPERLAELARKYGFHPPRKDERIILGASE